MKSLEKALRKYFYGEFDPGSGQTLAACLTHASRTDGGKELFGGNCPS